MRAEKRPQDFIGPGRGQIQRASVQSGRKDRKGFDMVERKVDIVRGTNSKPASSKALAKFFAESRDYGGRLFIGYPIIAAPEGRFRIDALWLSPDHGIVIFDLIEGHAPDDFRERQDNAYNLIDAKLRARQELTERRNLLVPVNTLSFAPGIRLEPDWEVSDYFLCNADNLDESLRTFEHRMPSELFSKTMSALQSISTIRKSKIKRTPEKKDSLGAKLKSLESSIATLDSLQGKAVVETVEGVQRIRGLAGSGKTIVLALKAAYLHAQHPEWRIAVTFNTRSLKGQFKRLINTFCIDQTGEEPDWENLRILNAWGAPGGNHRTGVYFEFCQYQDVPYFDFQSARHRFGKGNEFGGSCEEAIKAARNIKPLYEAILVDEAQDFSPWFLRLCYRLLSSTKRLVYAYDELQNLSGESMLSPEELFGKDKNGEPLVVFSEPDPGKPQSDIILEKCYRNSRPVLTAAHALGFGIYRKPRNDQTTGLVQMFDHPYLWEEIGYRVEKGRLQDGSEVVLSRTKETSPEFLENHSPIDDLVQFVECDSMQDQIDPNRRRNQGEPGAGRIAIRRHRRDQPRSLHDKKGNRPHPKAIDGDGDLFPPGRGGYRSRRFFLLRPRFRHIHGNKPGKGKRSGHGLHRQRPGLPRLPIQFGDHSKSFVHRYQQKQGLGEGPRLRRRHAKACRRVRTLAGKQFPTPFPISDRQGTQISQSRASGHDRPGKKSNQTSRKRPVRSRERFGGGKHSFGRFGRKLREQAQRIAETGGIGP